VFGGRIDLPHSPPTSLAWSIEAQCGVGHVQGINPNPLVLGSGMPERVEGEVAMFRTPDSRTVATNRAWLRWCLPVLLIGGVVAIAGAVAAGEGPASVSIEVAAPGPAASFTFSGGHGSFDVTLGDGDSHRVDDIVVDPVYGTQIGIDQAVESEPLLWRLTNIECDSYLDSPFGPIPLGDAVFGYELDSGYLWVEPKPGQDIRCTFTNTYVGASFSFEPNVVSGDTDQQFEYSGRFGSSFAVTLTDGQSYSEDALSVPYQYSVTQSAVPGWETEVSCTGGTDSISEDSSGVTVYVDVVGNENVRCTFNNTFVGSTFTLRVNAPDDSQQWFSFFGSYTDPSGDTTKPGGEFETDLRNGESYTEAFVVGEGILFAVSETIPDGWKLTGISCFSAPTWSSFPIPYTPSFVDLDAGFLQLDPEAGTHYRCTFENDYVAGRLSFGPDVVSGDPTQSFSYTARLDTEVSVNLVDGDLYGEDLFTVPDQFAVVQEAQPGWETTVRCTGGDVVNEGTYSDGAAYVHIDIAEYERVRCTFSNTYVNEPPVADAGGPYELNEGSSLAFNGSGSSDPDGDDLTYEWDLDNDGEYDDATGVAPLRLYREGPNGYTVGLRVTDVAGETDTDTATVTVNNVAPAVDTPIVVPLRSDEGTAVAGSAGFSDPGIYDTHECTVDYGDGSGPVPGTVTDHTCSGPSHVYADNGFFTVTIAVTDDDGGTGQSSVEHTVNNLAPEVSLSSTAQTVQYSDLIDEITIIAIDVAADELTATVSNADLSLTGPSCSPSGPYHQICTWTLSGPARLPAGIHTLSVEVSDEDGGAATEAITFTVLHEDALVAFGDNEVVFGVTEVGSDASVAFSLMATVREAPEAGDHVAPGDINLAEVTLTLEPVGPGSNEEFACHSTHPVAPYDYASVLEVSCDLEGLPVNAYVATVSIDGDYYVGNSDEGVVVIYDPSLGFTTGGGWFAWPGTGERTTFGYTMKYNKKATNVQGSLVVIRRTADGQRYRLKSNAISGLALGETDSGGWASFVGKATYLEPGMAEAEGNHQFVVYVEDNGEPGVATDRFWIEVLDKSGTQTALSLDRDAIDNAIELDGGNIVVPHKPHKGPKGVE
jgi:hypothetical protein